MYLNFASVFPAMQAFSPVTICECKKNHNVDNVEQNSIVKVIQQHRIYICNSRETCYISLLLLFVNEIYILSRIINSKAPLEKQNKSFYNSLVFLKHTYHRVQFPISTISFPQVISQRKKFERCIL
jgi:hypothetical protein